MGERIKTGVNGLDKIIKGGVPQGHIILISGTPGTGKSILCAQIAYYNASNGKKCLYLNLEQDSGRLENQMKNFGWDPEKVKKNLLIKPIDSTNPDVVDFVLDEIQRLDYDIIVLDSVDSISSIPISPGDLNKLSFAKVAKSVVPTLLDQPNIGRLQLKEIYTAISKSKATAFLPSEKVENAPGITRDTISEFLCDGIVVLEIVGLGTEVSRTLTVKKLRETKHPLDSFPMFIEKNGIEIKELEI